MLTERTRVARELHDTVEQGLAGNRPAARGGLGELPDRRRGAARQSLDVARQMLRYSLEETRRSVMDLRSQALESRDLAGALASLARQMTLNTHAEAQVRVDGARQRLDAAEEHHLLRIGLEALTNALKHGAATRIDIELRFAPDATHLIVTDNGQGMAAERATGGAHFGLQGVRERVDKLGGLWRSTAGRARHPARGAGAGSDDGCGRGFRARSHGRQTEDHDRGRPLPRADGARQHHRARSRHDGVRRGGDR